MAGWQKKPEGRISDTVEGLADASSIAFGPAPAGRLEIASVAAMTNSQTGSEPPSHDMTTSGVYQGTQMR